MQVMRTKRPRFALHDLGHDRWTPGLVAYFTQARGGQAIGIM
jgi:hypothetical protein